MYQDQLLGYYRVEVKADGGLKYGNGRGSGKRWQGSVYVLRD